MRYTNIGGHRTLNSFVDAKLKSFTSSDCSFRTMFELMFSEKDNIMYEKSVGYKIEYTTYGEAFRRINDMARRMPECPHDAVIGLYMENSLEWIITFWAIILSGHRPLLMNLRLSHSVLEKALSDTDAAYVVSDGEVFSRKTLKYREIEAMAMCEPGQTGSEVLVMSSGTSDSLKICAYSAEEFHWQIIDSYKIIKKCTLIKKHYDGQLKQLCFLPFYHVFGLIAVYIWFAFFSRTFVHLGDMSANTILNTIRRHGVTHIFAVPMFWNKVYDQALSTIRSRGSEVYDRFQKGLALSRRLGDVPVLGDVFTKLAFGEVRENLFGDSVCFMISGGSEIRSEVLEFFNAIGYHLANGYGMTETGITSVELGKSRRLLNSCSVGKPLSSVEYKIDGGRLYVKGKSTARYILENGKKTENTGWFCTNDGAKCENGSYYILGRMDDVVIGESGENLNPSLVEPLINAEGTRGVCLISGDAPTLLVSVDRHITPEACDRLREQVRDSIRRNGLSSQITGVVFTGDALMSAEEFKLNRRKIALRFKSGEIKELEFNEGSSEETDNETAMYVRSLFAAAFNKQPCDISLDDDFFLDEGGTSLDYFAMLAKIQEDRGVSLPSGTDAEYTTVRRLYEYIEETQNNVD